MRLPHSCAISLSFLELFGPALLLQNKFPVLICWQNITYASFPCAPFLLLYWIFSLLCASQKHQVEVNKCGHKRRKQKSICHFSMLVRVKQYTVLFFLSWGVLWVSSYTHWLANLFPQNESGQIRMLIYLSRHLSVSMIKKGAGMFCQHIPTPRKVCCWQQPGEKSHHDWSQPSWNCVSVISSFWLMLSSYPVPRKRHVSFFL